MYKGIELNKVKELLNNIKYGNNYYPLYKGITSNVELKDFYITNLSGFERESKTIKEHGNLYNLLLNNLPIWKQYPLRKNSIVLTNDIKIATQFSKSNKPYGKIYRVIPIKDSQFMCTPESDIWYSFSQGLSHLGLKGNNSSLIVLNKIFKEIFECCGILNFDLNFDDLIIKTNKLIKKDIIPNKNLSFLANIVYQKLISFDLCALELYQLLLNPHLNSFIFQDFSSIQITKPCELWTNLDCILVNINNKSLLGIK